ncbi:TRAFAC clade GTPase domain-containing protein [Raineyella sp. W15-4]|uniref:TRAFAC clade GTPase domain-containing protein n=1 Tax=Raineyella sp. W15-4 TaxID=3081651 RepID=UPI00295508F8|nr:hypothetical protein [Raineyella sp. W15-4]WOQ17302.1 hypothetical protein R0145_00910 [Raineyella sp. W15-4]
MILTSKTCVCPFCYFPVELDRIMFQCEGRQAPGRTPCEPGDDDEQAKQRYEMTGSSEPIMKVFGPDEHHKHFRSGDRMACPSCGGMSGIRVCHNCYTQLPPAFGAGASPMIGMVGAKASGKTVYMSVLVNELQKRIGQRFQASITFFGGMRPGIGFGEKNWLRQYQDSLYNAGVLPPQTQAASGRVQYREPLVVTWQQQGRSVAGRDRVKSITMSLLDSAGEDFNDMERVRSQHYLGSADALIVILDPFQCPAHHDLPGRDSDDPEPPVDVLRRVADMLRERHGISATKKIPVPIAAVFSKMDAFYQVLPDGNPVKDVGRLGSAYDEVDGRNVHDHVEALLEEWGSSDITTYLRLNFKTFRYFGVSALGSEPDYSTEQLSRPPIPHRVEDPLLWILSQQKLIPRVN